MNTQKKKREALWTGEFVLLLATAIFMYISTFMFTPTLPLFARNIGLSDPSVGGFIVLAYTLGSLMPRVFWGKLSDNWGRKRVYLIGLAIMTLATPFFGVFLSFAGIISIRLMQGVGFSATSTAAGTMSVDLVPESRRAEGIGYYALANTIGMAIAPGIGLFMLQRFGPPALLAAGFFAGCIAIVGGFRLSYERKKKLMAAASNTSESKREGQNSSNEKGADPKGLSAEDAPGQIRRNAFMDQRILKTALVVFFVVFPYGGIMGYIASYGRDLGIAEIGLYFTMYAAAVFAVRLFVGRLSDRYGIATVLIPGILFMASGLAILFWATTLPIFLISAVLFGFGFGSAVPILQTTAYQFCPPFGRGAVSAGLFATMDLAYGLGAMNLGLGIKLFGYRYAFVGSACVVLIGMILFIAVLHPVIKAYKKEKSAA